jgi:hypothetical protein
MTDKADHIAWAAEAVAVHRHCRTGDEYAIPDLICDLGHIAEERGLQCKQPRLPLRIKVRKGSAQKWPGFTPPRATASCRRSAAYYYSAAYICISNIFKRPRLPRAMSIADARKARCVLAEMRWRWTLKIL